MRGDIIIGRTAPSREDNPPSQPGKAMTEHYKHTQPGILLLGILVPIVVVIATILEVYAKEQLVVLILRPVLVVTAVVAVLFSSLTVGLSDDAILIRFGPGPIRKRFPFRDIATCAAVRNKWYYGCGIRKIPGGWLYNVSGLSAVELEMVDGRRNRIGTDEPQVLEEAVRLAMARRKR